jgi:trehalose 6-phosphate phosphatase
MRAAVRDVAKHFPTAIVSGRCRDKVHYCLHLRPRNRKLCLWRRRYADLSVSQVRNFVGLSELYYAGSHGMDIKGPSSNVSFHPARPIVLNHPHRLFANQSHSNLQPESVLCQPASEFLPMIDEVRTNQQQHDALLNTCPFVRNTWGESYFCQVYKALVEKTKSTPGAKVENNKFCLSVHFRCVDEKVGKPHSILGCQPLQASGMLYN